MFDRKTYSKAYRESHREQRRAYKKAYYQRPEVKEKTKAYYKTHKEQITERQKAFRQTNREQLKTYHKTYQKTRRNTDANFKIQRNLRTRLYFAFRGYGTKKKKPSKLYGIDFHAIAQHLGNPPQDGQTYVIDHIRPLCSFDFSKTEQIQEAFSPENHRWLPYHENAKKINDDRKVSISYGRTEAEAIG